MTKEIHRLSDKEIEKQMNEALDIILENKHLKAYLLKQLSILDAKTFDNTIDYTSLKVIQMLREKKVIK